VKTRITRSPNIAASVLREGGLVAFPTETVYGVGADALNAKSVKAIFKAKGRPGDNPLIVHIADLDLVPHIAKRVPRAAEKMIEAFFPGPLTVIVPRHPDIPLEVTAGLETVGIRFPSHPVARTFLEKCERPVAAPSANRSGRPSPTTWQAAHEEMDGRVDCILKGGSSQVGLESTVVDCTTARPVILREGAVTFEELIEIVPTINVSGRRKEKGAVKSPGMKYRHYAPSAEVILVNGPEDVVSSGAAESAYIGMTTRGFKKRPAIVQPCRGVGPYAQKLFHFFRVCEGRGIQKIYCEKVSASGLGRALMDRLQRAADDHPKGS